MKSKKEEKIINKLVNIGLSTYEAKAYLALVQNPDVSAYEISKTSGVPQSKIYENIKRLVKRGLAITKGTNPVKYTALPVEEFLERYRDDINNSINYIEKNINTLKEEPDVEYMWHFKGKSQMNNKIESIINNAKKSLYLEMWNYEFDFFYKQLLDAKERGVNIVTILYGKPKNEVGIVYYHAMEGME